jgi:SOS-response transcriptional repressor LexA
MDAIKLTEVAGANIRRLLAARRMTQAQLGAKTGMKPPDVSRLLKGGRATSLTTLTKVAESLGTTVAELLSPEPLDTQPYRVPLFGIVAAGVGEDEPAEPGEMVSVPEECKGADGAYKVRGLSMRHVGIIDGDYLFVRTNPAPDDGELVVAWIHETGNVVKRLERKAKRCILHSADGTSDPRYPYTMTDGDRFWGQLIAVFRSYQKPPKKGTKKK